MTEGPSAKCPACGQIVPTSSVDGAFLLHPIKDVGLGKPHGALCKMSGKRPPKEKAK